VSYLQTRCDALRRMQNQDGGWGYFPGKASWLEPTAYAVLALISEAGPAGASDHVERGWRLIKSWQRPDGAWRPNAEVDEAHWSTALAVTLHCVRGIYDDAFKQGVDWLIDAGGAEASLFMRIVGLFRSSPVGHDLKFRGWSWTPETSSWIEPTSHALVALKKAAKHIGGNSVRSRIERGEQMILARRCSDGGWNYGSKAALGIPLSSYPETTAVALLGVQGNTSPGVHDAVARARGLWNETPSRLAKAWLAISVQNHGITLPEPEAAEPGPDIMMTAVETLAASARGRRFLAVEAT
jgi:prenyltransferase/squalene oxidase-like repeat protein